MFYRRSDAVESKRSREMLGFTIIPAAGGRESRRCQTAGAGYVRALVALCSRYVRLSMVYTAMVAR